MFQLTGKRALITGAASGIGLAVARLFFEAGAAVVLADLDPAATEAKAAEIRNQNADVAQDRVEHVAFDVANADAVSAALAQVTTRPLDTLVNCAGVAHIGRLDTTSAADLDRLYSINVRGTALCMQAALPALLASRGSIVNLASIAATTGLPDRFAYSMTKGAVLAMTLSVARDFLDAGVRCNCISPARIHTPFVDNFVAKNYPGQEAATMERLSRAQPIGRMGKPEEVAALALYLCSEEASFLTGVDMPLDGGFFNLR